MENYKNVWKRGKVKKEENEGKHAVNGRNRKIEALKIKSKKLLE